MFDCRYVDNCVREGRILPNLLDYRLNKNTVYTDYDPVDVLLGHRAWSELERRDEGIRVSGDEFDMVDIARENDNRYRCFKSGRYPYTTAEEREILQYLVDRRAYNLVGGNTIWKRMEQNKVCNGNRWVTAKRNISDSLPFSTSLRCRSVPTFPRYVGVKRNDPPRTISFRLRNSERFTKYMTIFLCFWNA